MSKEAIGKIKENLNDKIEKINDETEQNCESLRQHIGALENAVSKIACVRKFNSGERSLVWRFE